MTEEAKSPGPAPEPSVSLTFRDQTTGKNVMRIICAVSEDERTRLESDKTGETLTKYVVARTLHQFGVKAVEPLKKAEAASEPVQNDNLQQ